MNHGMTPIEERAFSFDMSPQELILWHGMGACVHPARLADLKDAIDREQMPAKPKPTLRQRAKLEMERHADNWMRQMAREQVHPVTIAGVTYPNLTTAALQLGVNRRTLQRRKLRFEAGKLRTVVYRGQTYYSVAEAARATKQPEKRIHKELKLEKQGQGENGARKNGSDTRQRLTA